MRQQAQKSDRLCLSDFIHPDHDKIGVFATSVDHGLEKDFDQDAYIMHPKLTRVMVNGIIVSAGEKVDAAKEAVKDAAADAKDAANNAVDAAKDKAAEGLNKAAEELKK